MQPHLDLILTLTGSLAAALALGFVTHRIGLSPIVGYLLAGIVVGPQTPGFAADRAVAEQFAEIGVILLMFGVGLHFHVRDLLAVRHTAIPGAIGQIFTTTMLSALAAVGFGWGWPAGIVFGLSLSVASTVVLTRVLSDNKALHTSVGHVAVGWQVVEDLFTVVILVLLPELVGEKAGTGSEIVVSVAIAMAKFAALVFVALVGGGKVIPWVFARAAATRSRELFTLTVLVTALGIAVGAAKGFGVSMALGAFLAGMVVGKSDFSLRAASEALPLRDAFAVIFFVAAGMLFEPRFLWESPGVFAATLAIVLCGKSLTALGILRALKHPWSRALPVAASFGQIGEFSFILAALGRQLNVLPEAAVQAIVAGAIVSISVNPLVYRAARSLAARYRRDEETHASLAASAVDEATPAALQKLTAVLEPQRRAIVVGSGPVGQALVKLLKENDVEPRVIELNVATVRALRADGVFAVYGDAGRRDVLEAAGVADADTLILGAGAIDGISEIIRAAVEINPEIRILARCSYLSDAPKLRAAGAHEVFSGEAEIALAMTESLLRAFGATPDQIDGARAEARSRLTGAPATIE